MLEPFGKWLLGFFDAFVRHAVIPSCPEVVDRRDCFGRELPRAVFLSGDDDLFRVVQIALAEVMPERFDNRAKIAGISE